MHISIVTEQLRKRIPGGIGTYCRGLLKGLKELENDDEIYQLNGLTFVGEKATSLAWDFKLPLYKESLVKQGISSKQKLVHSTSFEIPPIKRVMTTMVHDVLWKSYPQAYTKRGIEWHDKALEKALKKSSALIVPSQRTKNDILNLVGSEVNIDVIAEGSDHVSTPDLAGAKKLLKEFGVQGDFLLTVSTIEPRKNLDRVVEAFMNVRKSLGHKFVLVVAGSHGWGGAMKDVPGVVLVGAPSLKVLSGLYSMASCLVYAPIAEGYGLPPIEAMMFSTPVVTSDIPSVEGIGDKVDPYDVDSISKGIYDCVADDVYRSRQIEINNEFIRDLTWKNAAKKHTDVWKHCLN